MLKRVLNLTVTLIVVLNTLYLTNYSIIDLLKIPKNILLNHLCTIYAHILSLKKPCSPVINSNESLCYLWLHKFKSSHKTVLQIWKIKSLV